MRIQISDPADGRVAVFTGMRDHRLRIARERDGDLSGVFIADGDRVIRQAIEAGFELVSLLRDPKRPSAIEPSIDDTVPVYVVGPEVAFGLTGMHIHRGTMACFRRPPVASLSDVIAPARSLLVAEAVTNPTNLGVMVRSAAGLGFDGLIVDQNSCDPLYRRAARVAMGASFRLPWTRVDGVDQAITALRRAGFTVVALTPDEDAVDLASLTPPDRVALLLGNEGAGIGAEGMRLSDVRARIPMANGVDSLNVGAAAAIACWAVTRPRAPSDTS